ncbi:hypothetical protein GGR51DRAFT_566382 [Nemania sp. FL0031]|nr:hypothetical protein GGR51DRAFT_566382 [Nemania sp. FL0031]
MDVRFHTGSYLHPIPLGRLVTLSHCETPRLNILVQNLNTGASFDLSDADCTLRLQNEINGCDRRVDPNNGVCWTTISHPPVLRVGIESMGP